MVPSVLAQGGEEAPPTSDFFSNIFILVIAGIWVLLMIPFLVIVKRNIMKRLDKAGAMPDIVTGGKLKFIKGLRSRVNLAYFIAGLIVAGAYYSAYAFGLTYYASVLLLILAFVASDPEDRSDGRIYYSFSLVFGMLLAGILTDTLLQALFGSAIYIFMSAISYITHYITSSRQKHGDLLQEALLESIFSAQELNSKQSSSPPRFDTVFRDLLDSPLPSLGYIVYMDKLRDWLEDNHESLEQEVKSILDNLEIEYGPEKNISEDLRDSDPYKSKSSLAQPSILSKCDQPPAK